ncbi:MAG TPA: pyridoxamine 5'-phosphate oxidase family protein [Bacillota bacterium]|nr:pyridoxamine 5'-phosphate oxidase family protein [Bacillota bacterium]
MTYHMRRAEREIKDPLQLEAVIKNGKYAVIALCRNNEPYIVTLSYSYDENDRALYFHGAKDGLKIEFLNANPNICLTIIDDQGYIPRECSHAYKTIVIRGKMELLEQEVERMKGIEVLIHHLEKNPEKMLAKVNQTSGQWDKTQLFKLKIVEMSGKERKQIP